MLRRSVASGGAATADLVRVRQRLPGTLPGEGAADGPLGTDVVSVVRAAARGVGAAMAMTGMRQLSTSLGLLERTPPKEILSEEVPALLRAVPFDDDAVAELAHWAYGGMAGAAFGLLPPRVRAHRAAGPIYGLTIWLGFEAVVAPALGITIARRRTVSSHLMLAVDHLLYGIIVAGQLAPEPARDPSRVA